MTKEKQMGRKYVSIISTGLELLTGDVINTSSCDLSASLTKRGIHVKQHLTVSDLENEIFDALTTVLPTADAIIITGGLGPTSDDRTRFALARFLNRSLVFNDQSWERICQRLSQFGIESHDSNRQQALFPEGVEVISNEFGTASGCEAEFQGKWIFMLPGPPRECLPMAEAGVIPRLLKNGFSKILSRYSWNLIGAVEGSIAAELDAILHPHRIETAYCWRYPYLRFSLFSEHELDFHSDLLKKVQDVLAPYLVSDDKRQNEKASDLLQKWIGEHSVHFQIDDQGTKGYLESALISPFTHDKIKFGKNSMRTVGINSDSNQIEVSLSGLDEYWKGMPFKGRSKILVEIGYRGQKFHSETAVPFRGHEIRKYAAEYVAFQIIKFLENQHLD